MNDDKIVDHFIGIGKMYKFQVLQEYILQN